MTVAEEPSILSIDEIRDAIRERTHTEVVEIAEERAKNYRFIEPMTVAAEGLIEVAQNTEGRFMLGIRDIDSMTRGFGRGELIYFSGKSHSGKSQLLLQAVCNNPDKRILWITPDEVSEMVTAKLVAMHLGIPAEDVERRIKAMDTTTIAMVRRAAAHDFKNLLIVDDSMSLKAMDRALDEAEDWWGDTADLVVFDFLELLDGDDDGASGVSQKSQRLKRWVKERNVPLACVHQASRTSSSRGTSAGMESMRYGGETEAIMVLVVYRKRDNESLDEWDRARHSHTLTVHLAKNKRSSKLGEVDLFIDPNTGAIRTLRDDDLIAMGMPLTSAEDALRVIR